ncbi:MAG: GTPase HflX [Victivallales bacterium]|nr:GTPase HflX [Victivallales bacterium]
MIDTEKDNRKLVERSVLIGVQATGMSPGMIREHMNELRELVSTMGVPVVGETTLVLKRPSVRYYVGSGKAEEIAEFARSLNADCLVFDCDLTPSQQRNWESLTKLCVIDRQEVIIDIFASRASTREAVIQVELARLQYSLPRLTRAWTHLSRQRGGAKGTRGEGEKQIEVDRRLVQRKIGTLKKELVEVVRQRQTQRKRRERNILPHAAVVGYTNAGKSSLINSLSGAGLFVEDKLFATLDPSTRRVVLDSGRELLMTDTVGFVRKLPHTLVESFKSTLEEAVLADLIILLLDASDPYMEDHRKTSMQVLAELGSEGKEILTVFNKLDAVDDPVLMASLRAMNPRALFISAMTGAGMDELHKVLDEKISSSTRVFKLEVPPCRHDLVSKLHRECRVLSISYRDDGTANITASIDSRLLDIFRPVTLNEAVKSQK